jgi:hypothetical protein
VSSVDCTRGIRLPGKSLIKESELDKAVEFKIDTFLMIGRIKLNRKKQKSGIEGLRYTFGIFSNENSIKRYLSKLPFQDYLLYSLTVEIMITLE